MFCGLLHHVLNFFPSLFQTCNLLSGCSDNISGDAAVGTTSSGLAAGEHPEKEGGRKDLQVSRKMKPCQLEFLLLSLHEMIST